ncbi:MAG: creatininase family protein [bacterium]
MNWKEVEGYLQRDNRIIVPIGSTEQHGLTGLIGTDHLIVHHLAVALAERTGIIAAPVLPLGLSLHHTCFPGTITLKPTTIIMLLKDVFWSLNNQGFRKVLLLNGHGGNRGIIDAALSEIAADFPELRIRFLCWWDVKGVRELIRQKFGDQEGHHSTPSELSIIMHFCPDKIKKTPAGFHPLPDRPYTAGPDEYKRLFPEGIVGANPDLASPEHGKELADVILNGLEVEIMRMLETADGKR